MQSSLASSKTIDFGWRRMSWVLIPILGLCLWTPEIVYMWGPWRDNPFLSHGPLVPVIAGVLIWMRRAELREWGAASKLGLAALVLSTLLYVASVWADIDFLRPLCLTAMTAAAVWFLGGWKALTTSIGAIAFLVFMVPWPTTLVAFLAFPMQLASSSYAAQLAGMLGLPIERNGVNLSVMPDLHGPPIYSIVVAQACSGLTSVLVLLALAYLIAYHTKIALGWRALLIASVIPMALLLNSVRLAVVLLVGAHYSASLAQWVHDHEEPVLIFFCSLGLVGLRSLLLAKFGPKTPAEEKSPTPVEEAAAHG